MATNNLWLINHLSKHLVYTPDLNKFACENQKLILF